MNCVRKQVIFLFHFLLFLGLYFTLRVQRSLTMEQMLMLVKFHSFCIGNVFLLYRNQTENCLTWPSSYKLLDKNIKDNSTHRVTIIRFRFLFLFF